MSLKLLKKQTDITYMVKALILKSIVTLLLWLFAGKEAKEVLRYKVLEILDKIDGGHLLNVLYKGMFIVEISRPWF